jgi:cytochrome c553
MKKIVYLSISLLAALVIACESSTYTEAAATTPTTTTPTTTTPTTTTPTTTTPTTTTPTTTTPTTETKKVTYTSDVKTIVTSNCIGCHGAGGNSPTLSTYAQVKNAASTGKMLCTIQANGCRTMPTSGKMPQATIDVILLWVNQGYIE